MKPLGTGDEATDGRSPLVNRTTVIRSATSALLCNLVSDRTASIQTDDDLSTIRDTTDALEHLTATHLRLLDARAASFARLANFKSAIQDAIEMINLAPQSGLGYLRAGNLMSIRGKQTSAIRTYNHALGSVSPFDPQYRYLLKRREEAQKMQDTKIDLISMVPLEIFHYILSFLQLDTAAVCSTVCKSWQKRFVECGTELWRDPCINDLSKTCFAALCHISPSVAAQVQSLTITNVRFCQNMNRLAAVENFTSIRSLHFIKIIHNGELEDLIMAMLHGVRATLTELGLELCSADSILPVGPVLTECNRLTSLKYVFRGSPCEHGDDNLAIVPVTSLYLETPSISADHLSKLLRRCPEIRDLTIVSNTLLFVPVIQSLCPNLRKLSTNRSYHKNWTTFASSNNVPTPKGLHILSICADYQLRDDSQLIRYLFAEHKNSLEQLDLRLPSTKVEWHDISNDRTLIMPTPYSSCNLHFSRLRVLHCHFGSRYESVPAAIICQCPTLEEVDLHYVQSQTCVHQNIPVTQIPDALKTLGNLQKLSLRHFGDGDLALVASLFHMHSDLGKRSLLHTIRLLDSKRIDELLLQSFTALASLKILELDCSSISDDGFLDFARQRSAIRLPLKTLKVFPGWQFSDTMIEALKLFEGLQHVTISSCNFINEELMLEYTATSKTLQTLKFHDTCCSSDLLTQIKRNGVRVQTFYGDKTGLDGVIRNHKYVKAPKPISWSLLLD